MIRGLFLLCALLLLGACSPIPLLSGIDEWQVPKPQTCQEGKSANLSCSDTLTATFDQQGRLWVAWVYDSHVYVQSSSDNGVNWGQPVKVNAEAEPIGAQNEYRPKIAVDATGNLFVTWTRSLEKRHTGHIRFSRSIDGGVSFSEPVTINDNLDVISHRFDSLLVGKNGEVMVVWLDARDKESAKSKNQEFLGSSVYYAWSNDHGAHFQPNRVLAAHSCECCRLATSVDDANRPVVLWRYVYPGGVRDHALIRFEDWQTPGPLRTVGSEHWQIDACPHHGPGLAIDGNGRYQAVWFSGAEGKQGLYYAYSDDGGASFSRPLTFGAAGAKHPHIGASGQRVAIVWMEFDGKRTLIRGMQSQDGGAHFDTPATLGETDQKADYPFVISDGDDLYLSWQSQSGYRLQRL
jgi:hypothetical protein